MKVLNWYINIIALSVISLGIFIWFDDVGSCTSDGNVWDYSEKICREDCLLWNKNLGCVKFTPKMMEELKVCANDDCYSRVLDSFLEELCLQYKMPYDKERNQCFWDFTSDMCHQLPGNWQYPKVCDK